MKSEYKIILTSNANPMDCKAQFMTFDTSLTPANEAILAQIVTDTLSKLYESQGEEMLCMWELDAEGREQKFYQ